MKIIFAGTPEIAIETLTTIHESDHELSLVLTNEDKPSGRGKKITKPPVKLFAEDNNIEIKQPPILKDKDFIDFLKSKKADLFVVFAYGHLIPEEMLKIFDKGALNIHTSLLPKLRGAAPIQRAIINGEKLTGVSFMKMDINNISSSSYQFDTIVMNPPFGTKNTGIDTCFVIKAMECSNVVYSLHKTSTRSHFVKLAAENSWDFQVAAEMKFNIPKTFKFHKEKSKDIMVDLYRLSHIT